MSEKWYAVQETSADAWDNGSSDFEEAKNMLQDVLAEHGRGLIAVIVNDFCEEEIGWWDIYYGNNIGYLKTDALAGIVRNADAWDNLGVIECMEELCKRTDVPAYDGEYESWEDPARKVQEILKIDLGI